ncbi:thiamine-phosphate kinase [Candidatus Bathyarchaeota archaeon]|nr:thiamine-phosphate kinase [Candidatus Bathyarchaeota archaeon]
MIEGLTEREIIKLILSKIEEAPRMSIPFGDDVSAVEIGNNLVAVLKTDMLVAATDVPPKMSFWQAARKAVVMNVSDFAAKGVKPEALLVSLGIPGKLARKDAIEQIAEGLNAGAREYGAYILGGDTNEACDLIIACMLYGIAEKNKIVGRAGAKPGDIVAVTGLFGKTAAGLKMLLEGLEAEEPIRERLVDSVLMPKARLKEGLALAEIGAASASIDSSDGLAWSLYEFSKASNVGFEIDSVPLAPEAEKFAKLHKLDPIELCFYGGEEYELVVTIKPKLWRKAQKAVRNVGGKLIKIGRVIEKREIYLRVKDKIIRIEARGWEHFRRK